MGNRFASGKWAIAQCDRCDQRFKLKVLRKEIIKTKNYDLLVCPECWDPDHPQNWVGIIGGQKVANDPQALREPRPDTNRNASCTDFAFAPVATLIAYTELNNVNPTEFNSVAPTFRPVPAIMGPIDF